MAEAPELEDEDELVGVRGQVDEEIDTEAALDQKFGARAELPPRPPLNEVCRGKGGSARADRELTWRATRLQTRACARRAPSASKRKHFRSAFCFFDSINKDTRRPLRTAARPTSDVPAAAPASGSFHNSLGVGQPGHAMVTPRHASSPVTRSRSLREKRGLTAPPALLSSSRCSPQPAPPTPHNPGASGWVGFGFRVYLALQVGGWVAGFGF